MAAHTVVTADILIKGQSAATKFKVSANGCKSARVTMARFRPLLTLFTSKAGIMRVVALTTIIFVVTGLLHFLLAVFYDIDNTAFYTLHSFMI